MELSKPAVTHVIFDFDGLLVDTEPSYTLANKAMLRRFDREFTMDLKAKMMGRKNMEAISWLLQEVGIADQITVEEYSLEYDAMLREMFLKCVSLPGAERLVRHFASKGIPMAICTGSCSRTFMEKAANHRDWVDLIPIHVCSGDDENIQRGKPFPDPFLETMKRFSHSPTDPSHVLVFEDAPNGVQAALAAGMQCVMVPDEMFREQAKLLRCETTVRLPTKFEGRHAAAIEKQSHRPAYNSMSDRRVIQEAHPVMTKSSVKVTHVIFDVDGTLLDTEICYTMANQAMLRRFGREFTADMQAQMMGRNGAEANAWLLKEVGISDQITPEEFGAAKDVILAEMFPKCEAFPGAERLVRHFARKMVPMAICSGSCLRKFKLKSTKHRSWLDLIPIRVLSGDDKTMRGKPFPDAFLETMRRFPTLPADPYHVLVFEDSPNGGKAAKAAGMQCVMIPDPKFRQQCLDLNVNKVLDSLEEFIPEEFGLPPFD